jgi:hypothetical protein
MGVLDSSGIMMCVCYCGWRFLCCCVQIFLAYYSFVVEYHSVLIAYCGSRFNKLL